MKKRRHGKKSDCNSGKNSKVEILFCNGQVYNNKFIRKAKHPHPCPLPQGRGDLRIAPPLGEGIKGRVLENVALLIKVSVTLKYAAIIIILPFLFVLSLSPAVNALSAPEELCLMAFIKYLRVTILHGLCRNMTIQNGNPL